MLSRDEYIKALRGLLSGDPQRIMEANRALYRAGVSPSVPHKGLEIPTNTEADLALAEAGV